MSERLPYPSGIFSDRLMAGARALWRVGGKFQKNKPIIAVMNSYTDFVPGHVHLRQVADIVKQSITDAGGDPREFNTIAIDDGIAMGHGGMLYSLPSRDLIADSIEYMCNAHKVDALVCIVGCDKIVPGALMATARLNLPSIVVSGGPMEAGIVTIDGNDKAIDLVDAMVAAADPSCTDEELEQIESSACPTCGSCSGLFTANSMNCLTEVLGLGLPGNGTLLATHVSRKKLYQDVGTKIMEITRKVYEDQDMSLLPRSIITRETMLNAMSVDIAMGGSTNTILHLLAIGKEAEVDFTIDDIDELSKKIPHLAKIAPSSHYHIQNFHAAGGVWNIMGTLTRAGLFHDNVPMVHCSSVSAGIKEWDIDVTTNEVNRQFFKAAPSNVVGQKAISQNFYGALDLDRATGCIRDVEHAYSADGGLVILRGNLAQQGCVLKTAALDLSIQSHFIGKAVVCDSQEDAMNKILNAKVVKGDVVVIRYEGPKGGPGMQEMLYPTSYLKSFHLDKDCALITDGRFSGGSSGLSIGHVSPEAGEGGLLALVQDGDEIEISIPSRSLNLNVSDAELAQRRHAQEQREHPYTPLERKRKVSKILRRYAAHASNASNGAVLD